MNKVKFRGEFRKEYFAKIKAEGYKLDGQMFVQMENDLYLEWLETKLQNTASNSDYAKCRSEIRRTVSLAEDDYIKIEKVLLKHFA